MLTTQHATRSVQHSHCETNAAPRGPTQAPRWVRASAAAAWSSRACLCQPSGETRCPASREAWRSVATAPSDGSLTPRGYTCHRACNVQAVKAAYECNRQLAAVQPCIPSHRDGTAARCCGAHSRDWNRRPNGRCGTLAKPRSTLSYQPQRRRLLRATAATVRTRTYPEFILTVSSLAVPSR